MEASAMSHVNEKSSSSDKRARNDGSPRTDNWICPSCGYDNFSFRTICNISTCNRPRPTDHISVDNRSPSSAKRARNDGSPEEDNWTCPSCGYVNLSIMTKCNLATCGQPRPAVHSSEPAAQPMQVPPTFLSSAPYVSSGAPSSISSAPNDPYNAPFPGGSAYSYNYGSHLSAGPDQQPLHTPGYLPHSVGSMGENDGMDAIPTNMDHNVLGMPTNPSAVLDVKPEQSSSKQKKPSKSWKCEKCSYYNIPRRTKCRRPSCRARLYPSGLITIIDHDHDQDVKPEQSSSKKEEQPNRSWTCEECSNYNISGITRCSRQSCGAFYPSDSNKMSPAPGEHDQ